MDKLNSCLPINVGIGYSINNIAFDGRAYYCTIKCNCKIVRLNDCYKVQKEFSTCREYDCICYDWSGRYFWASCQSCYNKLFKLDCNMNEIDCITVCKADFNSAITSISYKGCKDSLIVSFAHTVMEIEKCSEISRVLYHNKKNWLVSVLSLCPYFVAIVYRNENYYIEIFNSRWQVVTCCQVNSGATFKNLIFNPCKCSTIPPAMDMLLLKKGSYPYICSYRICFDSLGFVPYNCNYKICEALCRNDPTCDESCCKNDCGGDEYCSDDCPSCECRKDDCPDDDCCCEDCSGGEGCNDDCCSANAYVDVMESIALVEAALSHILNAEGEKIQKVLAETDDIDKIICVNREVNKTIVNATHLEHVLYAKLSALTDNKPHCKPCHKKCQATCDEKACGDSCDDTGENACGDNCGEACENTCGDKTGSESDF